MLETTNKLIEEMDELKKMVMTEVIHGNIDIDIEDMSEIKFLMKSFKALNLSMRLMKDRQKNLIRWKKNSINYCRSNNKETES
mgnify:CR=1 FL=1